MQVRPHQQTSALVLIKEAEKKPSSRNEWQRIIHKYHQKKKKTYMQTMHLQHNNTNDYDNKVTQHAFIWFRITSFLEWHE